ncbi:hypothetical protein [Methylophilus sp. DW102]|uniref:hypothetical protein n=1 Tax=Methylophilus sp. DW102 TaxID=3095607 RepID=UPI00308FD334|nr:hypothetical protein MTDW_12830 [Methylophilus sp. DW102]
MAKNLYVRVKPKSQSEEFFRCGHLHTSKWVLHEGLDEATAERLQTEQMLETSEEKPEGFDDQVEATPASEAAAGSALTPDAETGLIGSSLLPSVIRYVSGFEITLGDLVQEVHSASGLSVGDWNGLADQARETLLQVYVDQLNKRHEDMAALFKDLKDVETVRDALQAKVNELDSQVGKLQGEVTTLESELKKAQGELIAANEKLAATAQPAAEAKTTTKTKAK